MDFTEQTTRTTEITPILPAEAQTVFVSTLTNIIVWLQGISPVYFTMMIIVAAFLWVLGALFGSKELKATSGSTIILAVVGYIIVINAQALLGVIIGFGPQK
ncbi:MAG: hypothetical protein DDT32_00438 [Syntrophomonadaceae bacterium]|nr:hypothetical protein [Bacillota bacterium]